MFLVTLLLIAHPLQDNPRCTAPAPAGNASAYGPHASSGTGVSNGPWVTQNDYPTAAKRANQQGTVYFTLDINAQGCPDGCRVTRSSGYPILDDATCATLMRRARFKPAVDANGTAISATWSNKFTWVLD